MATYTDNYQLTKPTYAEQADIGVINSNMNKIDEVMHSSQISLADAYDSTKSYAEGDKVMYELLMYKCISPTTGVWDASKWERTTASESGGGGSAELDILGEASGAVASFADGASAGLAKCIAEIIPKQAGSGTPSPDNVRAISGYTSAKVSVNGKNFLNFAVNSTINVNGLTLTPLGDGGFIINGTSTAAGILVWNVEMTDGGTSSTANQGKKTLPNGSYKFSILRDGLHTQVRGSNTPSGGDNPIATTVYGEDFTIDDTYRYNWIRIQFSGGFTFNNETFYPMIRLATESAEYEPYKGSTTTIPLGQTVYGGTLNVLTGELTLTHTFFTPTAVNTSGTSGGLIYWVIAGLNAPRDNVADLISSHFKSERGMVVGNAYITNYGGSLVIILDQSITTTEQANAWLVANNPQFCYKLATPQTVQLTPQEVNSLLGQNNISADTGDIDIVYVKASAPIQPNPTGEPTATLTKLGIEGTVFEIPSGGGGSSGIDYLTTEHVIGTAEDENGIIKPLYEKMTYIPSLPNATETEYSLGVINIRKVYDVKCIAETSTIVLPLFYNAGNDNNSKIQMYVSDKISGKIRINTFNDNRSGMNGTVIIRYTKTTD